MTKSSRVIVPDMGVNLGTKLLKMAELMCPVEKDDQSRTNGPINAHLTIAQV